VLGELIDYDFAGMQLKGLYRISDQSLKHKAALEGFLYAQERTPFDFEEVITLSDLTNTYFEGTAQGNANAALGKSKEKRSDCPLVTLALVLEASCFAKRSETFAGNISEPKTLAQMLGKLASGPPDSVATVVLDAGIAAAENIAWLVENGYPYLVVSRKRLRQTYSRAAQFYEVNVEQDPASGKASAIHWQRTTPITETLPGVYCLRTNEQDWDEVTLWRTYIMLILLNNKDTANAVGKLGLGSRASQCAVQYRALP
jgi:transposase